MGELRISCFYDGIFDLQQHTVYKTINFAGDKIKQDTMQLPPIEDKCDVAVAINFITGASKPSSMEKPFSL